MGTEDDQLPEMGKRRGRSGWARGFFAQRPLRFRTVLMGGLLGFFLICGPAQAQPPGGSVVVQPPIVDEHGGLPRVLIQTVPDATVTATVLAIRYRRPGEVDASSPSAAHLLEHVLFRSRSGQPPGALLVRAESLGGQNLAYTSSGIILLGELVPSESGLESLGLQLERLRSFSPDASDLKMEKAAISAEITTAAGTAEEVARRQLLAGLGVDAQVEGQVETLSALSAADLEKLLVNLALDSDVVLAIVGPHDEGEVRGFLNGMRKPLKPERKGARPRAQLPLPSPGQSLVPSSYDQESVFLSLPELSTAQVMLAEALLREAAGASSDLSLHKEDQGLYRLDLSPATSGGPAALGQRLEALKFDDSALQSRLERTWLDSFEPPLRRAEMMALEVLDLGTVAAPPSSSELPSMRAQLVPLLKGALESAPSLRLMPERRPEEGFFPFRTVANANAALQRQTLTNGLSVVWQEMRSWPVVGLTGFFRLRRPLTPDECQALESKLEARSSAGLDYEVKPDALFFHVWCRKSELAETLASSATEIRALSESGEVLVEGLAASPTLLEEFFLGQPTSPTAPISGRTLVYPEGGELVLVGDIEPQALEQGLRPSWNGWFPDKPPRSFATPPAAEEREPSRVVPVPPGRSPLLLLGVWGPARSAPDFLPFNLAMQTLAGRPTTSLLARQLRDGEGLVQGVSVAPLTGSERSDGRQLWLIACRPRRPDADPAALAAKVQSWLSGLGKEALPDGELARTRGYLKAALKISTSTPRGRAKVLANAEFYRLSDGYSTDYAGLYDRIDPDMVRAVCQKHLDQPARWLYFQPGTEEARRDAEG